MLVNIDTIKIKDDIPRIKPPSTYKKRILFVGEASFLNTGFSVYYLNLIRYLYNTGKYEIAEFGSYAPTQDPRWMKQECWWKYYGNMPDLIGFDKNTNKYIEDPSQKQVYYGPNYKTNQFGEWKFSHVLMDFKPDIVIDIRDEWMFEFQGRSPLRKNFIHIVMPTVDGDPQKEEWMETFSKIDYMLTYTKYGKRVLEAQSGRSIKILEIAQPGYEKDILKPFQDRAKNRLHWNLNPELKIVGTTMRNQARKLFANFFHAIAKFKQLHPELNKKVKFLMHTSYPDVGWDLPRFIKRYRLIHSILFTYVCWSCNKSFISYWIGEVAKCWMCGKKEARLPNTSIGVDRKTLGEIYNLMDVYVQYSICEGFGMPILEAKACGIPVLVTNNTAMMEQVGEGQGGWPIKVGCTYAEQDTWCSRGIPDEDDFIDKLYKMLFLSDKDKNKLRKEAIDSVKDFTWENTSKKWEAILDAVPIKDRTKTWDSPPNFLSVKYRTLSGMKDFDKLSNEDFIKQLYLDILDRESDEKGFKDWLQAIERGMNRQQLLDHFVSIADQQNLIEQQRTGVSFEPSSESLQVIQL